MKSQTRSGAGIHFVCAMMCCVLSVAGRAATPDPVELAARLHSAAVANAIDVAGLQPWHMKIDIQLFDAKGKPSEKGTIEEWWASPEFSRVTYAFPSYAGTQLHNKDGFFQTEGKIFEPPILDDVLQQVVHPMRRDDEIDLAKPELRKQSFGKTELECIMLDQPLKNVAYPPLGLFPTFCLDPGKNDLRISTELGSLMFVRNRIGLFQGHAVVVDLSGNSDGVFIVTAHVSTLSGTPLTAADFTPGPDMEPIGEKAAQISPGVVSGTAVSRPQPIYPEVAKQKHITGTVVLHAIIGRDGRIESLHLISTPDSSLAISAISAVKLWTYRPYLLNGVPTEVETTITVNFAMNP